MAGGIGHRFQYIEEDHAGVASSIVRCGDSYVRCGALLYDWCEFIGLHIIVGLPCGKNGWVRAQASPGLLRARRVCSVLWYGAGHHVPWLCPALPAMPAIPAIPAAPVHAACLPEAAIPVLRRLCYPRTWPVASRGEPSRLGCSIALRRLGPAVGLRGLAHSAECDERPNDLRLERTVTK